MRSDWVRVALPLSKILCSSGLFSVVCKTNKLVSQMLIHNQLLMTKEATMRKTKAKMRKSFQTLKLLNVLKSVIIDGKTEHCLGLEIATHWSPMRTTIEHW